MWHHFVKVFLMLKKMVELYSFIKSKCGVTLYYHSFMAKPSVNICKSYPCWQAMRLINVFFHYCAKRWVIRIIIVIMINNINEVFYCVFNKYPVQRIQFFYEDLSLEIFYFYLCDWDKNYLNMNVLGKLSIIKLQFTICTAIIFFSKFFFSFTYLFWRR